MRTDLKFTVEFNPFTGMYYCQYAKNGELPFVYEVMATETGECDVEAVFAKLNKLYNDYEKRSKK